MKSIIESSSLVKAIYGLGDEPVENWLNYCYALLTIAGSDGEVSKQEMDWLIKDFATTVLQAPDSFIQKLKSFDYRSASLEKIIPKISFDESINSKKALVYDAVKMARADADYNKHERNAIQKTSKLLGLSVSLVKTIEGLVFTESSLEVIRRSVFEVEDHSDPKNSFFEGAMMKTNSLQNTIQGDELETHLNYGFALMIIAGADGEISEEEFDWYENVFAKEEKIPPSVIYAIKKYDYKKGDLVKVLSDLPKNTPINFARTLLYNSIKMARADKDYALEEREAVRKAAKQLEISNDTASTIEYLIDTEEKLEKMRKSLLELQAEMI